MQLNYAIVWIDQFEARVILFNAQASRVEKIRSHPRNSDLHPRADPTHAADDPRYFPSVAYELTGVQAVLVAGREYEKMALAAYLASTGRILRRQLPI